MATYWENSCSFGLRYVSWYKYLIVSLVFSHLGFWSGNLFLIAPFPDLCLLVPFDLNVSTAAKRICHHNHSIRNNGKGDCRYYSRSSSCRKFSLLCKIPQLYQLNIDDIGYLWITFKPYIFG